MSELIEIRHASESSEKVEVSPLSPRELKVLMLMFTSGGFFQKGLASKLGITERTVRAHTTNILKKLNIDTTAEALVIFQQALFIIRRENPDFTLEEFQETLSKTAEDGNVREAMSAVSDLNRALKTEARNRKERAKRKRIE